MSTWLTQRIADYADRECLAHAGSIHSYTELHQRIREFQDTFHHAGIQAGDMVTLLGDYSLDGIAALLALFELNAIAAPIAAASADETRLRADEAQADWTINLNAPLQIAPHPNDTTPHPFVQNLRSAGHPGLVLFSSGSTGKPKAMIHDAERLLAPFQKKRPRRHRILIFLLFDHIGGLNTLFNALATGALIVAPAARDADTVAQAIATHRVNLLPASPTFLNLLLISGAPQHHDLSSLRFITYGTEPMPESLLHRIQEALPHVALIQTFGTSETGISQTVSRSSDSTLIKFDDPNTEFKIVDGELWLRSKSQILGYLNHSMQRFTNDGWFRTGDLVEPADNGFMRIIGRREDLINVGGEKVTPSEVESILLELPEIADCLVYGEANAISGQNVAAEIVPNDPDHDPRQLKRSIKKHCRAKLSAYKVPARIRFTDATTFSNRFKKMRIEKTTD